MLKDILGRQLKAGDFVLYGRKNSEKVLNYGLIVSDSSIFDGKSNYSYADDCYLITSLDEKEKEVYEKLYTTYSKLQMEKQKKKLERNSKKKLIKKQEKFGIYQNARGEYYLYLGKMKYNPEFIKERVTGTVWNGQLQKSHYNENSEGHAYLTLYYNDVNIKKILSDGKLDISEFLYSEANNYSRSKYKIEFNLTHYYGYRRIELLKGLKSVETYLGKVELEGLYHNMIYAYALTNGESDLIGYPDYMKDIIKSCWLDFID